jgi:transposase
MGGSKKGHGQGAYEPEAMKLAVNAVLAYEWSEYKAAKYYQISRQTLRRKLRVARAGQGVSNKKGGPKCCLSETQEEELCEVILQMEASLYGLASICSTLTQSDICNVVYKLCEKNGIANKFNTKTQKAGKKWFRSFMKRHKNLSVRKPEPTSIQRAQGFNQAKVDRFYDVLQGVLLADDGNVRKIPPENIFNVDESGFTVCQSPQKILVQKGKRSVGILTSAEKGKIVSVICCILAAGFYVPPAFIFPRVRLNPALTAKLPPGSLPLAAKTGWMNEELFTSWFEHFLRTVHPQRKQQPVLLIFDGHASHVRNVDVITKAKENNVILLMLPSHCTHRLEISEKYSQKRMQLLPASKML